MSQDLPIYSQPLRTRLQFADLERLKHLDVTSIWEKSDAVIPQMEGASNVSQARQVQEATKAGLLRLHSILFDDGALRPHAMRPVFRGQDCPEPQFIERSLDNFMNWMSAESIAEIHPIERAALVITRIIDIWPFSTGNMTAAIVFANIGLRQAGLAPFFVLPEHQREFNTVLAQAMTIETQPLVNAIYGTIKRELDALAG